MKLVLKSKVEATAKRFKIQNNLKIVEKLEKKLKG
jgi:ribosomal protein L35